MRAQPVGATTPGSGLKMERKSLKGVDSFGMLCSAYDCGWVGEPDGVLVVLPDEAEVGEPCPQQPPKVRVVEVVVGVMVRTVWVWVRRRLRYAEGEGSSWLGPRGRLGLRVVARGAERGRWGSCGLERGKGRYALARNGWAMVAQRWDQAGIVRAPRAIWVAAVVLLSAALNRPLDCEMRRASSRSCLVRRRRLRRRRHLPPSPRAARRTRRARRRTWTASLRRWRRTLTVSLGAHGL